MHVYGPAYVHGAQPINPPHQPRLAQTPAPPAAPATGDRLDISAGAQLAARLNEIPEIRQDKVAAARAAIASSTYETDGRLDVALDRLLDEIA